MSTLADAIIYDVIGSRPAASIPGRLFFASDTGVEYRDNGASWVVMGTFYGSGATGTRPTVTIVGARFFDTTLNLPIWWDGSQWVDATGNPV